MFGNTLKINTTENKPLCNRFGTKQVAHFIGGKISHTLIEDNSESNAIQIGTIIKERNKKVVGIGNKVKIKNQIAIELLLEDGKWVSCYLDSKKIIKIPNTPNTISRMGDINSVNGKEVVNVITDKGELTCLFTENLNKVGIHGYNKGCDAKIVTHIFKCRK